MFSQLRVYISHSYDFLTRNFEFICKSEKKNLNCAFVSCNHEKTSEL